MDYQALIHLTADLANCDLTTTRSIVNSLLDVLILKFLEEDYIVLRPDFGSFMVRKKGGGGTAADRAIPKIQKVVSFKAAPSLKKRFGKMTRVTYNHCGNMASPVELFDSRISAKRIRNVFQRKFGGRSFISSITSIMLLLGSYSRI